MNYKFHNANSRKIFTNDCVVRAVSLSEGKSWDETYEELSDIAQEYGILLDDVNFVEPLLDSRYDRVCYHDTSVGEFVIEHPVGVYLITMPNHITCAIDGIIYDTFDCTDRFMWCAWCVDE